MARLGRTTPRRLNRAPVVPSTSVPAPGVVLDIGASAANHFDLQYAQNGAGSTDTATQADIAAGFQLDPYFVTTADGARVQLWARLDAPVLGGSSFSRSELREVNSDGSAALWDANTDIHALRVKFTPTHLPSVTPAAVFAQMYDTVATADRISIRTQLVSGTARLRIRINGSTVALDATSPINPGSNDLATGVGNIVGVEWDFKVVLTGGAIAIYVNDIGTPVVTRPAGTLAANGAANYFKTGVYNQANTGTGDSGTDWGSSEIRGLAVTHTPALFPTIVANLPALTGSFAATVTDPAALTTTLPALAGSTAAGVIDTGALVAALPALTGATTGDIVNGGPLAATLPNLTGSLAATATASGTLAATLPALVTSSAGTVTDAGQLTAALPALTAALAADVDVAGVLVTSLPALAGASAGDTVDPGDAAGALPLLAAAFTATITGTGQLTATLPALVGTLAATSSTSGPFVAALPALTGAAAADVTTAGELVGSLPMLAASLSTSNQVEGDLTAALPELAGSTAAAVTAEAQLAAELPTLAAALTGTVGQTSTISGTLPTLAGAFTAAVVATGSLTGVLPALAGGFDTSAPTEGTLDATLPALTGQITAAVRITGALVAALPMLAGELTAVEIPAHLGPLHADAIVDGQPLSAGVVPEQAFEAAGVTSGPNALGATPAPDQGLVAVGLIDSGLNATVT